MRIGLIAGVLLGAAMPLLASVDELEKNVIRYIPKTMQPNLPGKLKSDEIIRKRRGHVEALKKFAPYILDEYSAIDKAMKWPTDTYLNTQVFGVKKNEEKAPHECTSWIIMPDLTASNTLILHKNRDSASRKVVISISQTGCARKWIALGSGSVNIGLNSSGLAAAMNSGEKCIDPPDVAGKKSTPRMLQVVLENCDTAAQAVEKLKQLIKDGDYFHGKRGSVFLFMDTHSKDANGDYDGVSEEQIRWYESKSDELKAENGGVPVPSYVFEHIPVRQINSILKKVPFGTENATFTPDGYKVVDPEKHMGGNFYEYPNPTGDETNRQYESWVEKGDIVAAFFGHDHTNSFYGKTDDGIILGYNASFGWKAYGMGSATRQLKMIVVDEDDPRNPEIYSKTYKELTGEKGGIGPIDFISPWTYNVIINNTIGKIVALILKIFG